MTDRSVYIDPSVSEDDDDGTMPDNVAKLAGIVVGRRIVAVDPAGSAVSLTLDTGKVVRLVDTDDCCAYTAIEQVVQHLPSVEHIITAVTTSEGYTRWHILADAGQVLELLVGWSCGNPFYYGYGLQIEVADVD